MGTIAKFYSDGGGWMHPILFMSIIGLGIMIERFIFLYFKYNINAGAFMAQIQKLIMANNIDRAIKLCAAPIGANRVDHVTCLVRRRKILEQYNP